MRVRGTKQSRRLTEATAHRFLSGRVGHGHNHSYLSTAAKHGRRPFDVLTELTSGNVWIPAAS
jgi:hypothetical protein